MATVYSAPQHIKTPEFNIDTYEQDEKQFVDDLRTFCKSSSKCKDAGEIIRFPIADGYAQYMIFTYAKLIHIPTGDAYQIPDAHARGLRAADITQQIKSQKAMTALFIQKAS